MYDLTSPGYDCLYYNHQSIVEMVFLGLLPKPGNHTLVLFTTRLMIYGYWMKNNLTAIKN